MRTYRKSNIFLFLVFLLPGLVSCCKIQDESPAMPISGSGGCTVTVTCVPEAQTAVLTRGLTPEEESRIADVNLWAVHTLTGIVEHRYLHGAETVPLTLTQGRWRLYAVANHGSDLGTLDAEAVEALRADIPPHAPDDTDFLLPMAGRTETDVSGPASVTLTLERLAARVRLDIETAPEIAGRLNILEVQPLSVPSGVVCFSGDAVGEFGDWPPQECGTSAFSAVYYHVYPGDNGTSDFNLRRNRTYVLNVTLCGANPEDARVAACDMTLTPSAGEVQAGQTFSTRLCFTARNNADNTFDLAWRFISGEAEVSVSGGLPDPPGVFYYGLAGNEIDEYFDIAVTSDREGPVELEFYSTDRYGQVFARRVTVNFLAADRIDRHLHPLPESRSAGYEPISVRRRPGDAAPADLPHRRLLHPRRVHGRRGRGHDRHLRLRTPVRIHVQRSGAGGQVPGTRILTESTYNLFSVYNVQHETETHK